MTLFFYLMFGHVLMDFALQNEYIATHKNHTSGHPEWSVVLGAHALLHGGTVALITGNVWLGVAETVAHVYIDYKKSDGAYNFFTDQFLHICCKAVWTILTLSLTC